MESLTRMFARYLCLPMSEYSIFRSSSDYSSLLFIYSALAKLNIVYEEYIFARIYLRVQYEDSPSAILQNA